MAWMRLEQGCIDHPKFLVLSHGAFRLWHEGKAYCDRQLTDGLITREALRGFRYQSRARVTELTAVMPGYDAGLWETHPLGFQMHDYLAYNDCREAVLGRMAKEQRRRERDKGRIAAWREKQTQEAGTVKRQLLHVTPAVTVTPPLHRDGMGSTEQNRTEQKEQEQEKSPPPVTARSKRPVFSGQRLTVFEFHLDDCLRTLGPHADAFDLHEWFFELDGRCVRDHLVLPARDYGPWLQAQLVAEAQRRGLPLHFATGPAAEDRDAAFRALVAKGPSVRP